MKISHTQYAIIDGEKCNVTADRQFVKYRNRWRLIQIDESGQTYFEAPGVTASFELKQYNPEETKKLDDLYPHN